MMTSKYQLNYEIPRDTPLPLDFQPGEATVICGRGRDHYRHAGNRRFRALLLQHRENYVNSSTRARRSLIILDLVQYIRRTFQEEENRPDSLGAFVRRDRKTGRWFDVGDACAKEKVGHTLRDPNRTKDTNNDNNRTTSKKRKSPAKRPVNIVTPSTSLSDVLTGDDSIVQRQQQLLSEMMQPKHLPSFYETMNAQSNDALAPCEQRCDQDDPSIGILSVNDIESFFSSDEEIELEEIDAFDRKEMSSASVEGIDLYRAFCDPFC